MQRSHTRILTTHTGSLPRPPDLIAPLFQMVTEPGSLTAAAAAAVHARIREAVAESVHHQIEAGIDVISDGEQSKAGFNNYLPARLSGFASTSNPGDFVPLDLADVPELHARLYADPSARVPRPVCVGPVEVRDPDAVHRDIAAFTDALYPHQGRYVEAFMTAPSPGAVAIALPNTYYPSREAYLDALASALSHEYQAIIAAGLVLQVDCPDLAMDWQLGARPADWSIQAYRAHIRPNIEAVRGALAGLPAEQLRIHVCYGNYPAPHHHDLPLAAILDLLMDLPGVGLSVVAANAQHRAITYQTIRQWVADRGWPDDKVLILGAVDTLSVVAEHPETIAELLERYGELIGREHLQAGTDCGFATMAGLGLGWSPVAPSATWSRLRGLHVGAAIASRRLWAPAGATPTPIP